MRLQILVVTLIIKYPEIPRRGDCAASCGQTGQTWRVNSKIPVNLLQGHPNVHATLPTHYLYYLRVFKFTMTNMANRPSQAYTASALKMEAVFFPKVLLPSSTLLVALTQQTKIWTSLLKQVRHFRNIKYYVTWTVEKYEMTSSECEICICLLTCVKVLRPLFRCVFDDKEEVYSIHGHYITGAEFSYTHCVCSGTFALLRYKPASQSTQ